MWKKIVGYTLLAIITVAGATFAYLYYREPASQPPKNIQVAMTKERIERGKYIFTLADCEGCHSPHDATKLYFPALAGMRGAGQHFEEGGLPGKVYAPNITPDPETGIGKWTDGEKIRAIREGVSRDGRALFPMMPYQLFRHMSDNDVEALVAYLNTLPAVRNPMPRTKLEFPVSMLIKGAPEPVTRPVPDRPRANTVAYGEYLVTIGVCEGCHSPMNKGSFVADKRFGGGREMVWAGMRVVTANISPDKATGIGNWTLDYFLDRFRRHRDTPAELLPTATAERFTLMPWRNLSQLRDDDLAAIFVYLQSRPPVENKVTTHPVNVARR